VRGAYERLAETFALRPFVYAPTHPVAIDRARGWEDPGFPIAFPGDNPPPAYEPYTLGANYGRVRVMTLAQLEQVNRDGSISWQDILALDLAPTDVEGVLAAVVTGGRQGELGHLAVRTARRGTPNAYVQNAHEAFGPFEGQLVRLEV